MDLQSYYSPIAQSMEQNPIRPSWTMQRPGVISLAFGFPDAESFPYREIADAAVRLMEARNADVLQYGPVTGPVILREFVAGWLRRTEGIEIDPTQVIITSGASQAIVLAARLVVPPGGTVLVESPTFIGTLWFLRGIGVDVVGVPMDSDGLDPGALRETVRALRSKGRDPKLVYTMPTVHNPVGTSSSLDRRRALSSVAEDLDLLFLEDDAYGDLIFDGDRCESLYRVAGPERVIKTGTFSKLVAGGMRLGWAIAGVEDIDRMAALKADNATSPFAAWITAEYLQTGALEDRIPDLRRLYRSRRDAMLNALEPLAEFGCTWTPPVGGFFLWLSLPEGVDSEKLRPAAEDHGVTYLAGHHCYADGTDRQHIRMAYSYLPEEQITEATGRLVTALRIELS